MKIAVKLDGGELKGLGGYHYMVIPIPVVTQYDEEIQACLGNVVIEVSDEEGKKIMEQAKIALNLQADLAIRVEEKLKGKK